MSKKESKKLVDRSNYIERSMNGLSDLKLPKKPSSGQGGNNNSTGKEKS